MNDPKYQVALSFAGEQRDYVEEVAGHLQNRSIALFYDGFERVGLWDRSGPGTVRLTEDDARKYVASRFGATKFSHG